jgi:N-sulfoglucosamine sulfohydrolase
MFRKIVIIIVLTGLWLSADRPVRSLAQKSPRPNILWISAEDLSPDLSSYGDRYARTPNLDRLASQGARYTNAFSTAPVCAPSRSAIITGMYATSVGSHHMRSKAVPPPHVKAFTEYLRASGYYCTNNSKTDYNFEAPPSHRPPDTVWDETSNKAHWRNRPDKNQPFFAVFNLMVTHEGQVRSNDEVYAKNTSELKPEDFHDPAKAVLPPYYPDTPVVRKTWARYYDLITSMDYQVATILKQLEDDGLADNTVVLFWGDHGRGLTRAKRWVYDSGIRVPLIVRWPGQIKPGTVTDEIVSLVDLGPTALSIAGVQVPSHIQGRPFLGNQKRTREHAFAHRDRMDETYDMMRAVRDKRFKYIKNFFPGRPYAQYIAYMDEMPILQEMRRLYKDHFNALSESYGKALNDTQLIFFKPEKPPEELYDLTIDPHEVQNLAGSPQHQDVLKRLRAVLDAWQKETNDLGLVPENELRQRMRPGGVWVKVAQPVISESLSSETVTLKISCPTEGVSFAYATEEGKSVRWLLYTGELTLKRPAMIRVKGCRFGYLDSEEVTKRY